MSKQIDQQIDGISIYFKLSEEEEKHEEDTAKAKLINELQKKADEMIFPKRVSGGHYEFITSNKKLIKQKKSRSKQI